MTDIGLGLIPYTRQQWGDICLLHNEADGLCQCKCIELAACQDMQARDCLVKWLKRCGGAPLTANDCGSGRVKWAVKM